MKKLIIAHLYPVEMNIYGDRGNVLALAKRLEWRGLEAEVVNVGLGDKFDLRKADIIFAGGGQDRGQVAVGQDLLKRRDQLHQAATAGVVMLAVCGTYQLFGRGFTTLEGQEIPGVGIFKAQTIGSTTRMIGNLVVESSFGQLVGFENHSGQTTLDAGQQPLGKVIKGYGNNASDRHEGAIYKNVYGTYLHGSLLPKNPQFADHLLLQALQRKYRIDHLEPLDDTVELQAAQVAATRPQ
ncbi:MAG TPA: glutamine amidotransferase [Candidatus Saccharimonadales bacterium]|nr:glutamine amidotransferase [Candidatus Saccharimonadales bacterium]